MINIHALIISALLLLLMIDFVCKINSLYNKINCSFVCFYSKAHEKTNKSLKHLCQKNNNQFANDDNLLHFTFFLLFKFIKINFFYLVFFLQISTRTVDFEAFESWYFFERSKACQWSYKMVIVTRVSVIIIIDCFVFSSDSSFRLNWDTHYTAKKCTIQTSVGIGQCRNGKNRKKEKKQKYENKLSTDSIRTSNTI